MKKKYFRSNILIFLFLLILFGCTTDMNELPVANPSVVNPNPNTSEVILGEIPVVTSEVGNVPPVVTEVPPPEENTPSNTPPERVELEIQQYNDSYYQDAQKVIQGRLGLQQNNNKAKNVILFVSDGAGPSIVTATRIFDGQQRGMSGEEHSLSFEKFPYVAVTKTYTDNSQTPDSAGTATAIFSGVKTKQGVIGIGKEALRGDCIGALNNPVTTVIELAEEIGMSTGIVTTTRLTHATPAATFAHSGDRNWESSVHLPADAIGKCKDIAAQLIDFPYGDGIDVAFGGGRQHFLTNSQQDPEDETRIGSRTDNRDLTQEWKGSYIWNKTQFDNLDQNSGKVLGLFNSDHMEYEYERVREHGSASLADEPNLIDMTIKAIELLQKNQNGYVLVVEAGRVDHAAHEGNAYRMLTENVVFSETIQRVVETVDLSETLIIATADHDHTVTLSGYAQRGNNILGLVKGIDDKGLKINQPTLAQDNKPYTVINFATGPNSRGNRPSLTDQQVLSPDYLQQALIPSHIGTHGGSDVITYATGPMAHLVGGVIEQNYIFHVVDQALDITRKR